MAEEAEVWVPDKFVRNVETGLINAVEVAYSGRTADEALDLEKLQKAFGKAWPGTEDYERATKVNALFNSEQFKQLKEQYEFLQNLKPSDLYSAEGVHLENIDEKSLNKLQEIADRRDDLDDLFVDSEVKDAQFGINELIAILGELNSEVKETNNEFTNLKETTSESFTNAQKTQLDNQIQKQQELKQTVDAANESLKEQTTIPSPVSSSVEAENKTVEEPAPVKVEEPEVAKEVVDLQKEIEAATEKSNEALREQQTIVNKDVKPTEVVSDQTIQKEKEMAQVTETVVDTLREQASVAQQTDSAKAQTTLKEETQQANQEVQKLVELLKEAKTVSRQTTKAQKKETNLAPATQEEELENLIRLLKEYYDLSNKAFKSTGNVRQAYSNELARLDSLIAQADPELRSQALTDIRVSVPKAKYDDAVAAQTAKELDEAERAAAELQKQTEQSRLEAEALYETYLDAISELNRLNMRNNLALATEQDNKALQENVDRQNEVVISLRRRIEAQRELLDLSDADIQSDIGSRAITSEKQQEYFNNEYF